MKKTHLYFILLWIVSLLVVAASCSDESAENPNQEFSKKEVPGEERTESHFSELQFIEAFPGLPEFSRPLALFEIPNDSGWMLLILQGGEIVTFPKKGPKNPRRGKKFERGPLASTPRVLPYSALRWPPKRILP